MATRKPVVWNAGFEAIQSGDSIDQIYITNLTADLLAKAPLASPAFTGTPTAPTAALNTNTTQLATTAYVLAAIADDAPTKTGGGASGTWGINVTGSAATLTTARTINGTSFNGSANITTANWGTSRNFTLGASTKAVNGAANVAWTLAEIGAAPVVHTHEISEVNGLQTALDANAPPPLISLAELQTGSGTLSRSVSASVMKDWFNWRLTTPVDRGNGFISWTGEATVTSSTSVALVDSTGALLSPTKTYKVAACNIDSSAQRGAVALFVGDGDDFTLKTVYEQGIYSSNVQLYLNAGVPTVSVYGGSGSYRIVYLIEEIPNFGTALSELAILQRITDAPSDGKSYVRKDGMWVEATVGGSMIYRKQATFTSSGTFTLPNTALSSVDYDLCGGGGAGGAYTGTSTTVTASGGGGGARKKGTITLVPGTSYSVVIGAGGLGANPDGATASGGDGGASSFAGITADGGKGGKAAISAGALGGFSGDGSAPPRIVRYINNSGFSIVTPMVCMSAPGGSTEYATLGFAIPGGIGFDSKCSGGGGAATGGSMFGGPGAGNGYYGNGDSSDRDATTPGSGGGGLSRSAASSSHYSGKGFRGQLDIIYWDTVP